MMEIRTIATTKKAACTIHTKTISTAVNLPALSQLYSQLAGPAILGGNSAKDRDNRFSYWAAEPKEIFEFNDGDTEPFLKLGRLLNKYQLKEQTENTSDSEQECQSAKMFYGGWIGYFAYELGRYIEKIPATVSDDLKLPLIRLGFYDKVIAYDHVEELFIISVLRIEGDTESPWEKIAELEGRLAMAKEIEVRPGEFLDIETADFSLVKCNMSKDYYLRTADKIKRYIYDGEVYQINFSLRYECEQKAEPVQFFHWQNQYNPAGYAAFLGADNFHIVSASPEMFITINGRDIITKPIKGTRPRFAGGRQNPEAEKINAANFAELVDSPKELAELNMIVDLERNDLARICKPGTRGVITQRTIETFPTVFHAVATIGGQLRDEVDFCDVLRAMFPGGSITGAPKIRAMEIIDETEPTARSVYTGSIGYIGIDGNVCLNIAIRTAIIAGQKIYIQAGGGIVADSQPESEWQECITKARALIAGTIAINKY
jgi:para-aminobenzoate synthetase component 1